MAQSTITRFYTTRKRGKASEDLKLVKNLSDETLPKDVSKKKEIKAAVCQSPKRNINTTEESTPSKKKPTMTVQGDITKESKKPARRKLQVNKFENESMSGLKVSSPNAKNQLASPKKILTDDEKLEALINQSRSRLLFSSKKEELKKALASFSEKTSKIKDFESNPCKITSVARSSTNKIEKTSPIKTSPVKPAHERFRYLVESPSTSLILPVKYKILCEMFQSMDTVVSILNNRKEKVTFEKVKEGVQKMMKRNFAKLHLGQIMTVYPSAYTLELKKPTRKIDGAEYELIISPNLCKDEDGNYIAKPDAFVSMHPQTLLDRKREFNNNILEVVKKHHQDFLDRINFPSVSGTSIKFWHPKFPLDSIPDIQPAELPEPPDSKIYTAKDVLNVVKGSLKSKNKVEKALQRVAEESAAEEKKGDIILTKPENAKSALKGICTDLIEKIRARESAKLLETMTRDPGEVKRKAMLERLPKIISILWHYFIAERKAAVPVDVAVEKIIHSLNTLSAPDDVKEHLKLITETFPGWLTFVKIPKGTYITIDKKRNINDMLANFAC
ncbi:DNA replication factor Cdt1-like [Argiope bruennichi]|uniref:DNA replication factor Cdt1 like protein n=1 Tax=Argiope bruennichi TaxID=94029 RepID=A0A8T0FC40_ARGBR|nr:DNA replication factor Cdt1-like [Argiope bruennichi]KAF8786503.1 DNA replication factor Cdt1 like protein [Argiope bruennichi]